MSERRIQGPDPSGHCWVYGTDVLGDNRIGPLSSADAELLCTGAARIARLEAALTLIERMETRSNDLTACARMKAIAHNALAGRGTREGGE